MMKTAMLRQLLLLTLLAASCQNPERTNVSQTRKKDKVESPGIYANERFPDFWKRFRSAVIRDDTSQLIALTEFPLDTRGPDDSDSTIEFKKERFVPLFRAYLHQYDGLDMSGSDELAGIKKTTSPQKKDYGKSQARVGDLVFEKKAKGWKLVFAYLNYETIDSLKK
ncbi:MAG: hypothetical protein ACXVB6_02675 [Mucilaginibacter sp.]